MGPNAREVLREHDPHAIWLILRDQLAKDAQGGVFQRIAQQMVRPQWEGGLGLLQEDGQGGLGPAPQSEDALQLRHWFMQSLSAQGNEGLVMFRELNITRAVLDVLQSAEQVRGRACVAVTEYLPALLGWDGSVTLLDLQTKVVDSHAHMAPHH